MATPQMGIFALGTAAHDHLEFTLRPGAEPAALVAAAVALGGPSASAGGVNLVVGLRPSLWRAVAGDAATPADAADFTAPVTGPDGFSMPATPRDLWVWVAGSQHDLVFDASAGVVARLAGVAAPADETVGWSYRHNRDLTGFIDGTENPVMTEAPGIALVPDGAPGEGAAVVLLQKWVHDTAAWGGLPDAEQERVIGRTKPASVEFDADRMPKDSHVSRTKFVVAGAERDIFRRNTPFGSATGHGTYFVGFCGEQRPLHGMLAQMAGIGDGVRDALTRYTSAESGSYYVVPSAEQLHRFAPPDEEDD